jgi:hypothetical protein
MKEYKSYINGVLILKDPTIQVRGNFARAYFYMPFIYRIHIRDALEKNSNHGIFKTHRIGLRKSETL